jgi:hypothetical protein
MQTNKIVKKLAYVSMECSYVVGNCDYVENDVLKLSCMCMLYGFVNLYFGMFARDGMFERDGLYERCHV